MLRNEYKLDTSELAQRYFHCKHCNANGEVAFGAEGSSGWVRDGMLVHNAEEIAARQAEIDLRTDAMRTQALIRCPCCGERASGAARWAGIRIGFWAALAALLPVAGGVGFVFGAIGCGGLAIFQTWRELGRFRRADRARILKLEPGTVPEAEAPHAKPVVRRQLAPPPDLPQARVVSVPALVVEEEPDPTAPPKFLVDADKA